MPSSPKQPTTPDRARISRFLSLVWKHGEARYRSMPWRPPLSRVDTARCDPYRILVSEVMLQQTQVARVETKFREFCAAFPSVEALAVAPLSDVLRLWSGLGYNRRAKHLHEAAQSIVRDHQGVFPRDMATLMTLPGVGRSTAAGIASFSWNAPEPMIDVNIRRILARVFFQGGPVPSDAILFSFARGLIPEGKGRRFNYALLDIAAGACGARCVGEECPFFSLHGVIPPPLPKAPREAFRESRRFLRGAILRTLSHAPQGMTPASLARALPESPHDRAQVLRDMEKEGLIHRSLGRWHAGLPLKDRS